MITVLTWLWNQPQARTAYTSLHVNVWADMVSRNLTIPHVLACVTDIPQGIDPRVKLISPPREFERVRIPTWPETRPQCFRRLSMFRRDAAEKFGDRFACMDLDCVVSGSLDSILGCDDEFRIAKGTADKRPYNGSLFVMNAGARPQVYEKFDVDGATAAGRLFLGSDQAWLAYILGADEKVWTPDDGVAFRETNPKPGAAVTFYTGKTKPWQSNDELSRKFYRRTPRGKVLILSYGPTLWEDVDIALESHRFTGVIASPEAADHWPAHDITAVADTDSHAEELAVMLGFEEQIWCGRRKALA